MKPVENYTLDDLPRFSPWPARLLGHEPWKPKQKTPEEITREYETEKWGPLLERVKASGASVRVNQVDAWMLGSAPDVLCATNDGKWELMPALKAHLRHLDLVERELKRYWPATALVELGCGYGSVILSLAKRLGLKGQPVLAGEYTESGVALVKLLAQSQGMAIDAQPCDFLRQPMTKLPVPPGALIFTSYATSTIPMLPAGFIDSLAAWQPRAVVHFEPCYEHCPPETLLGLLRKQYIKANDYNRNLLTELRGAQKRGKIEIINEQAAVFGMNALFPASIIAWRPS